MRVNQSHANNNYKYAPVILWFIVNIFTSVSFQCRFGSYGLGCFVVFFSFLRSACGFGIYVCVCICICKVRMVLNNNISWNKIVRIHIKIKHMGNLKKKRSWIWNLILKVPKLYSSCRRLARIGIGGYLQSDFLVKLFFPVVTWKTLHKQEQLTVSVVYVIKQIEENSWRAAVFKC